MGYGDWLHWTGIIKSLYKDINISEDPIKRINYYIEKYNNSTKLYGVVKYKKKNDNKKFKIYSNNLNDHKMYREIFKDNPYITFKEKYPNLIYFNFKSSSYRINNKFLDQQHVVDTYCQYIGLKKYNIETELYFTDEERKKVKRYIPNIPFIYIEPNNHKVGRGYPLEKFQKIVNALKDKILFIQVSPSVFSGEKSKLLNNVFRIIGVFTFRESILFMSYSKFVLVNHGGLSIASNSVKVPTLAIYNAMFNPRMTQYDNEISVYVADDDHHECNIYFEDKHEFLKRYPRGCPECQRLYRDHNYKIIINTITNQICLDHK